MKRKISAVLFGLMFLIGFGILVSPTAAHQSNTYLQNRLISSYYAPVYELEPAAFQLEWA
mgnify:CR=1 FL=1